MNFPVDLKKEKQTKKRTKNEKKQAKSKIEQV